MLGAPTRLQSSGQAHHRAHGSPSATARYSSLPSISLYLINSFTSTHELLASSHGVVVRRALGFQTRSFSCERETALVPDFELRGFGRESDAHKPACNILTLSHLHAFTASYFPYHTTLHCSLQRLSNKAETALKLGVLTKRGRCARALDARLSFTPGPGVQASVTHMYEKRALKYVVSIGVIEIAEEST